MDIKNEFEKFAYFHTVMHNRKCIPELKIKQQLHSKKIASLEKQINRHSISSKKKKKRPFSNSIRKAADIWVKKTEEQKQLQEIRKELRLIKSYEKKNKEITKHCIYFLN